MRCVKRRAKKLLLAIVFFVCVPALAQQYPTRGRLSAPQASSGSSSSAAGWYNDGGSTGTSLTVIATPGPINSGGAGMNTDGGISARYFTAFSASGENAYAVQVNGARTDFGAGASDYASSDGTTVTFAGPVTVVGTAMTANQISMNGANIYWSISDGIVSAGGSRRVDLQQSNDFGTAGVPGIAILNAEDDSGGVATRIGLTAAAPNAATIALDVCTNCSRTSAGTSVFSVLANGSITQAGTLRLPADAPTSPVACTSPTITHGTTSSFQADVGSSCTGVSTFAFTVPATTNGMRCTGDNISAAATRVVAQSAGWTGTTVTMTNYSRTLGTAADFADGADLVINCVGR